MMCTHCGHQTSVTTGTIIHRNHLPLRTWFRAIWLITNQKHGISALGLQRLLGLGNYKTAWSCLQKLRRAMVRSDRDRLIGHVEVDETYAGGVEPGGDLDTWETGLGSGRRAGGGETHRTHPSEFDAGHLLPKSSVFRAERHRVWIHGDHGRMGRLGGVERSRVQAQTQDDQREREDSLGASAPCPPGASLLKRWLMGIHQEVVSREQVGLLPRCSSRSDSIAELRNPEASSSTDSWSKRWRLNLYRSRSW